MIAMPQAAKYRPERCWPEARVLTSTTSAAMEFARNRIEEHGGLVEDGLGIAHVRCMGLFPR